MTDGPTVTALKHIMEIREYLPSDEQSVEALVSLVTEELRKIYRPKMTSDLALVNGMELFDKLVAVNEDETIGVVEYRVINDFCYIQGLAVSVEYRMQGIAKKLIDKVALVATSVGVKKLTLATIEETKNIKIFEKVGFKVTERILSKCFESVSYASLYEIHMERRLA